MSVNSVNWNCNASYSQYLQKKKDNAISLAICGGGLASSASALHLVKAPVAAKHPWLLFAGAALGTIAAMFGLSKAASISKELKTYQQTPQASQIVLGNTAGNVDSFEKPKMSKEEAKFVVANCINPMGPNAMFYLPKRDEALAAIEYYKSTGQL